MAVLEWLVRLLNVSFDIYKRNGDKCKCSNSRDISLLTVVGKLFGRVLIKRVRAGTECAIGEEQCGFRRVEDAWTKCLT